MLPGDESSRGSGAVPAAKARVERSRSCCRNSRSGGAASAFKARRSSLMSSSGTVMIVFAKRRAAGEMSRKHQRHGTGRPVRSQDRGRSLHFSSLCRLRASNACVENLRVSSVFNLWLILPGLSQSRLKHGGRTEMLRSNGFAAEQDITRHSSRKFEGSASACSICRLNSWRARASRERTASSDPPNSSTISASDNSSAYFATSSAA